MDERAGDQSGGRDGAGTPLVAFAVTEPNEATGGIVFAKHNIAARVRGAHEWNDGEIGGMTCKRAPWADQYAGSDVPVSVMVEHGWHFECTGCGVRMEEELQDWREGWEPSHIIGTQHSMAFCNQACSDDFDKSKAIRKAAEQRWIERFKKIIWRRFGDVKILNTHAYANLIYREGEEPRVQIEQLIVGFDFPGLKYGAAELRYRRRSQYHCPRPGDGANAHCIGAAPGAIRRPSRPLRKRRKTRNCSSHRLAIDRSGQ